MTASLQPAKPQFGDDDPRIAYNRVVFALLRIDRTMVNDIAKELRSLGIPDLIWFEILLATEEAGEDGVQMLTLQKRLFVPQYTLSRLIGRIETAGLIRREASNGAGRGQRVFLSPSARGLRQRIWQVYEASIRQAMAGRLSTDEAYDLVRLLNRLYS